ncbi:MAG: phosphonopyruvate decarboxylase [Pseudomonadota bacterium]
MASLRAALAVMTGADWSAAVHAVFRDKAIRQIGTVPDAGLTRLLELCTADNAMRVMTLTREDEGVGLVTGAWFGGERAALLMQSSGVGNVINALSLPSIMKAPCLMLVTMRGQWGEANSWQVPMGQATPGVLEAMGVTCYPVDRAEDVGEAVSAAADMAFKAGVPVAVLIGQRVIGSKAFEAGTDKTADSGEGAL